MATSGTTVLITGGAGFLGKVIAAQLLEPAGGLAGVREVRIYDRSPADPGLRVTSLTGDVRDLPRLREACRGADAVIHCAALVDWGRVAGSELEAINVGGTRNVIQACRQARVPVLVHTSTLDVVYTGRPISGGDETLPVPPDHHDGYMRTKAEAERLVVAANGSPLEGGGGQLRTCVIRPASIWGEGDPYHLGSLLQLSRWAPLIRVGRGEGSSSFVYVGNVAHAHLVAARDLLLGPGRAAGRVYFAVDPTPCNFFERFEPVLAAAGRRVLPRYLGIPRPVLDVVATGLEAASRTLRPWVRFTPTLTRFAVDFICLDFTIRGDRIASELGYRPRYSEAEALARTVAWARALER